MTNVELVAQVGSQVVGLFHLYNCMEDYFH